MYIYPAIFKPENEGGYSIVFPDFDACFTQGEDITDGVIMAQDVLCLVLCHLEDNGRTIPSPSDPASIKVNDGEFVTLVTADTLEYRKRHDTRAVKKTLTIPMWLDEVATKRNVNFSQTLQNALIEQLHLQK